MVVPNLTSCIIMRGAFRRVRSIRVRKFPRSHNYTGCKVTYNHDSRRVPDSDAPHSIDSFKTCFYLFIKCNGDDQRRNNVEFVDYEESGQCTERTGTRQYSYVVGGDGAGRGVRGARRGKVGGEEATISRMSDQLVAHKEQQLQRRERRRSLT